MWWAVMRATPWRRPWFNSWVGKIPWRRDRLPIPVLAGFPTHVKLQPKNPELIRYVIANGAECEPT